MNADPCEADGGAECSGHADRAIVELVHVWLFRERFDLCGPDQIRSGGRGHGART
jgi:hypothetical protein